MQRNPIPALLGCASLVMLANAGCSKTRDATLTSMAEGFTHNPAPQNAAKLLQGSFVRVAKNASGKARYALTPEGQHQLVLEHVEVDTSDPVHVYLLAGDDAPTTASVEQTEDKYDIGLLDPSKPVQAFDLPSAPDPELRVAVLWNVRFGVNLAQAHLR